MTDGGENVENTNNDEERNNGLFIRDEFPVLLVIIKVVVVVAFMLPLAEYSIKMNIRKEAGQLPKPVELPRKIPEQKILQVKPVKKISIISTCPKPSDIKILKDISDEVTSWGTQCTPEDFSNINKHKIPKKILTMPTKKEAKVPAIVNYAVGIVLMGSLAAALLELYRAKRQPEKKDGKNSLSRKCSLADLTVMKHQRKEMVRRESILELPEENLYSKQLDNKPSTLHRQSSFPARSVAPCGVFLRRRLSMQTTRYVPVVDGRPAAVLEGGRRHSIVTDGRQPLILETRASCDPRKAVGGALGDSPERIYHRRVHRH
ncbi:unnamed protein product [Phyllotreta striolata]|uniref:Uncharacterized protein n=1 Tax=Phyllotreta striolata TaxID=444603 RepID=A0A9N9TNF5_PHYSR|nr:unnamed protein product [Phyllotreta striolata]